MPEDARAAHPHYHKPVGHLKYIDVYRVLALFEVTDPAVQHAIKKLLVPGKRGAGKSREQDIREAVTSLNRALQMIAEDDVVARTPEPARPRACAVYASPGRPADVLCLDKPCTKQDGCPNVRK